MPFLSQIKPDNIKFTLINGSTQQGVSLNDVNLFCLTHFGDQAHLAKQKLLSGESVLILGKGYLRLQPIEQNAVLF
ncbi:hypothetical protein [Cysteiniphilum litorale]|uniref:Uncharacterized protein n=1 Tax=Cysteiniphilum litorale TaxID=2056700 RepID=A0A8J2Z619_9GAMM|nr:hypothetical protein [Cysteiniphilum litorale]GGG04946.1 hypothetical protein GCM10010995_22980 [Cysteiniphilum litorale]